MDDQSKMRLLGEKFTDRGGGEQLVLSATRSSWQIAEQVEAYVVYTARRKRVKAVVFCMPVCFHFTITK